MKSTSFVGRFGQAIKAHKIWTTLVVIVLLIGGYYWYTTASTANAEPQYTVARARIGSIIQTVTGTGQVSASNQLDVASQVSGQIDTINVKVGDHVTAGQLLATIDDTQAAINLQNAKIAYSKLIEPPKATDLANAQAAVVTSYSNTFNNVSGFFLDMPAVISGLKDLFYGQGGFLSDQQSTSLVDSARALRNDAGVNFDATNAEYVTVLAEYKNLSRASATSSLDQLFSDTYKLAKDAGATLQKSQNTVNYIVTVQPNYFAKDQSTATSNVNTWSTQINNDIASLLSGQSSIQTSQNALTNLNAGADVLDIKSQGLTLDQQQQTYNNYFIRAPFAGTVGRIPVNVYSQAGNGTAIATIIGDQKIATLSLNEVDAASVKVGDPVSLTFNAINNFTATGTVQEIDQVGTVVSGVVSYAMKVTISTTDSRINPGMSVNATITTNEIDGVLTVPSLAVKTQGNANYVQVMSSTTISQYIASLVAANSVTASSTGRASFTGQYPGVGSTTATFNGSTTRQFGGGNSGTARPSVSVTITTAVAPQNQVVTVGATDGTNTQILTGISAGTWVITKTVAGSAAKATTSSAPSLLSSLGAGGRGTFGGGSGGGAARTTTAAPAAATRPAGN